MLASSFSVAITILSMIPFAQNGQNWFETMVGHYWNGDYEQTLQELDSVSLADLSDGEKLEVHKYRAFSYIALGDNEHAQREFSDLLSIDPEHEFDTSLVSPKIIAQFDAAKKTLVGSLFAEGKTAYFAKDYQTAANLMDRILRLEPANELAKEYRQLSAEQITLTEKLASIEARESVAKEEPEPEPEEEPEDRIYHLAEGITPPVLIKRVDPAYPPLDFQMRRRGRVVLLLLIGKDGSIEQARVVRSVNHRIDAAALKAVEQWRYKPASLKGTPVRVSHVIAIDFETPDQ